MVKMWFTRVRKYTFALVYRSIIWFRLDERTSSDNDHDGADISNADVRDDDHDRDYSGDDDNNNFVTPGVDQNTCGNDHVRYIMQAGALKKIYDIQSSLSWKYRCEGFY